jgi:DNA/RNA-binding domain of Phe-tRNA-synthetase-like protein
MLSISGTEDWRTTHPGAVIGLLELSGVENSHTASQLDLRKRETEARLREIYKGYSRQDFLSLPVMSAYARYYKQFEKTYHVLLQVESLVLKGKNLPDVSPLVDSNFTAEVETLVLTAGHDAAKLRGPVVIDVTRVGDQIVQMSGTAKALPAGDMVMRDAQGVCCTILYGQDDRSPISPVTTHVLFVSYAPAGVPVETVDDQLLKIEANIKLFSPAAVVEQHRLLAA